MEATTVAGSAEPDFGTTTVVIAVQNDRYQKLLRLRAIKRQLAELRPELEQLEQELFGEGAI
jgi:hypothetical protein